MIMRTVAYSGFFLATCFTPALAADPTGDWKVADGVANIRVAECNGSMWGAVSWEKTPGGRDKSNPDAIAYLQAENAYADAVMKPTVAFQESLYAEMLARIKEDDQTVPYRRRGFFYQALAPLTTVAHTRSTGQISHNNAELRLLCEVAKGRGVTLDTAVFQYPDPDTPLSWHLTAAEKNAVWNAYGRCRDRGVPCEARVRDFMQGQAAADGCTQFEEPPRPAPTPAQQRARRTAKLKGTAFVAGARRLPYFTARTLPRRTTLLRRTRSRPCWPKPRRTAARWTG